MTVGGMGFIPELLLMMMMISPHLVIARHSNQIATTFYMYLSLYIYQLVCFIRLTSCSDPPSSPSVHARRAGLEPLCDPD